jgi:hypothetical protein
MGVRITQPAEAVLYDLNTGLAFGPIFRNYDEAEQFLQWWKVTSHRNLLRLSDGDLRQAYCDWLQVRDSEKTVQPKGTILCDNCDDFVNEWVEMESLTPGGQPDKFCHSCAPRYQKKEVS